MPRVLILPAVTVCIDGHADAGGEALTLGMVRSHLHVITAGSMSKACPGVSSLWDRKSPLAVRFLRKTSHSGC